MRPPPRERCRRRIDANFARLDGPLALPKREAGQLVNVAGSDRCEGHGDERFADISRGDVEFPDGERRRRISAVKRSKRGVVSAPPRAP